MQSPVQASKGRRGAERGAESSLSALSLKPLCGRRRAATALGAPHALPGGRNAAADSHATRVGAKEVGTHLRPAGRGISRVHASESLGTPLAFAPAPMRCGRFAFHHCGLGRGRTRIEVAARSAQRRWRRHGPCAEGPVLCQGYRPAPADPSRVRRCKALVRPELPLDCGAAAWDPRGFGR